MFNAFANIISFTALGLDSASRTGGTVHFFIMRTNNVLPYYLHLNSGHINYFLTMFCMVSITAPKRVCH